MIGLLTETIGNPTPMDIPLVVRNQLPRADLPYPIAPQRWHFRQSIDYSITANRAVLDFASRYRETLLYNIYRMGKNSIERGSRDTWTTTPDELDSLDALHRARSRRRRSGARRWSCRRRCAGRRGGRDQSVRRVGADEVLHGVSARSGEARSARLHHPADQPDFLTATKFVNALRKVERHGASATAPFTVAGKSYPAGSYVVKTAQAFRPHVLDMFEPQDHPNDFAYPGGPPTPPYDNAG